MCIEWRSLLPNLLKDRVITVENSLNMCLTKILLPFHEFLKMEFFSLNVSMLVTKCLSSFQNCHDLICLLGILATKEAAEAPETEAKDQHNKEWDGMKFPFFFSFIQIDMFKRIIKILLLI